MHGIISLRLLFIWSCALYIPGGSQLGLVKKTLLDFVSKDIALLILDSEDGSLAVPDSEVARFFFLSHISGDMLNSFVGSDNVSLCSEFIRQVSAVLDLGGMFLEV